MYRLEDRVIMAKHCAKLFFRLKNFYLKIKDNYYINYHNIINSYINYHNIINYYIPFILGFFVGYLLLPEQLYALK